MEIVLLVVALVAGVLVMVLPVKWAARAVKAERHGAFWCLLAIVATSILHGLGTTVPVFGSVVAFLLSAIGFAAILGTNFVRGVGIAILHVIFTAILISVLLLIFGGGLLTVL